MEFSTTVRGNQLVLYQGFEYSKYRVNKTGVSTWRCRLSVRDKCPAILKLDIKNDVVGSPPTHSHDSNPIKAQANILRQKMKTAMKTQGASPKGVIDQMLQGVSPHVLDKLPKTASLARVLSRVNGIPDVKEVFLPLTAEFAIPSEYEDLVLYDSGDADPDRILAVGDAELLQHLDQELVFGDGTYDYSPEMIFYLFTFHAKVGTSHPPCIYFLLTHNDMNSYIRMFDILKTLCPRLKPNKVFVDLSRPCMVAARDAFPKAIVQGTYFHLLHNLLYTIDAMGLKEEYDDDVDAKLALKSLAALAFVPPADIDDHLNEIVNTFPVNDQRYLDVINSFIISFVVGENEREPMFPIDVWNHYDAGAEMGQKSSSCCAIYHNVLNSMFHLTRKNNVWSIFEHLRKDIEKHKSTLGGNGNKCRQLALQLATIINGYAEGIDKIDYLRQIANIH